MHKDPIYLRIDPTSKERQLIHLEGIGHKQLAISNVAILATFECYEIDNKIKVEKIDFEMHLLPGLLQFGIKEIKVKKKPIIDKDGKAKRVISITLSTNGQPTDSWLSSKTNDEILWEKDDIIDNKVSFHLPILGDVSREDLGEKLKEIGLIDNSKDAVPVLDRPCQFKLVKELS